MGICLDMSAIESTPLRPFERLLAGADAPPWSAVLRIALGWAILPAFRFVAGPDGSARSLLLFFFGILILVRLVPAVLRKLLPFSTQVRTIWSERRMLAKRFDSYQWQKLFWIGAGWAGSAGFSGCLGNREGIMALTCVACGGAGLWIWMRRALPGRAPTI